jgi:hypothetical protein
MEARTVEIDIGSGRPAGRRVGIDGWHGRDSRAPDPDASVIEGVHGEGTCLEGLGCELGLWGRRSVEAPARRDAHQRVPKRRPALCKASAPLSRKSWFSSLIYRIENIFDST